MPARAPDRVAAHDRTRHPVAHLDVRVVREGVRRTDSGRAWPDRTRRTVGHDLDSLGRQLLGARHLREHQAEPSERLVCLDPVPDDDISVRAHLGLGVRLVGDQHPGRVESSGAPRLTCRRVACVVNDPGHDEAAERPGRSGLPRPARRRPRSRVVRRRIPGADRLAGVPRRNGLRSYSAALLQSDVRFPFRLPFGLRLRPPAPTRGPRPRPDKRLGGSRLLGGLVGLGRPAGVRAAPAGRTVGEPLLVALLGHRRLRGGDGYGRDDGQVLVAAVGGDVRRGAGDEGQPSLAGRRRRSRPRGDGEPCGTSRRDRTSNACVRRWTRGGCGHPRDRQQLGEGAEALGSGVDVGSHEGRPERVTKPRTATPPAGLRRRRRARRGDP